MVKDLIYPYFVINGKNKKVAIKNFPGTYRFSIDRLLIDIKELVGLGIDKVLLFGVSDKKDDFGSSALSEASIVAQAVRAIKIRFPRLVVMTDICLCAYTTHGHCGILNGKAIDNKKTVAALAQMSLIHAKAGADWVAPSAMAKGQVKAIRALLDKNGLRRVKILAYSAKFASSFYGPFRNAANCAPQFGDRSAYQLNYLDRKKAIRCIEQDIKEGADMVMVKPALSYLDIIYEAKQKFDFPIAAYNVSGEYSLLKHGVQKGFCDEKKMVHEVLNSIKRSGADWIITYHAKEFI